MDTAPDAAPAAVASAKATLRRTILAARTARFSPRTGVGSLAVEASRLRRHLSKLVWASTPTTVAAYMPFGSEPGGADLAEFLALLGPAVIVPVLLPDKDLDWRPHNDPGRHLGVAAISQAELVIVPALAVDVHGYRLGRGGGSYDRALARARPHAIIVALLYEDEFLPDVPHEPHDRRVNVVLTPIAGVRLDR